MITLAQSLAAGFIFFAAPFAIGFILAARRLRRGEPLPPLTTRHPWQGDDGD